MLTNLEKVLFLVFALFSVSATYLAFERMALIILRGQGSLRLDHLPRRVFQGLLALISQGKIIKNRKVTSLFHYGVAWGFIFYALVNLVDLLDGYLAGFRFLGDSLFAGIFRLLADLFSVAVLAGMVYFLIRRFLFRSRPLQIRENVTLWPKARQGGISRDSLIVGFFILGHVGSRFLGQSFLVASEGGDPWQPFASLVAGLWGSSSSSLIIAWHVSWWLALGLILLFLPYFPYTKHAHLFMGPLNFMTRPERAALGAMDPLDFADESIEQFGVSKLLDLPQTALLDAFACIMCNRCQEACPAYATGKELSPAALEVNKRYYIKQNMAALAAGDSDSRPLLDYAISESALWACTSCAACVEVCPVGNEPMMDILQMRRDQVLMESRFPEALKGAFNGMERLGNPWGMTDSRLAWAEPLPFKVPTVEENPDYEVLYWVGCAGAFDPHAQEIARATATVLHSAGINFAILGEQESCTGDSARRAGNEYLFYEMATANIETLNAIGADQRTIVTGCPHCFTTLGKEYGPLGGHYRVMHHTQMIADLVGKGKLRLKEGNKLEQVTFHDPCYLGRHNGEYRAPRQALEDAGMVLLEMGRSKNRSFCCGAGGAQMWKEEEHGREAVNMNRFHEAEATGAQVLATGCPFCARMMGDAQTHAGSHMAVKDVAEVVAAALAA